MNFESSFYLKNIDRFLRLRNPISVTIYFKNFSIDLLSGEEKSQGIAEYFKKESEYSVGQVFDRPKVTHLFFELGYWIQGLGELIDDSVPLVLDVEYSDSHVSDNREITGPESLEIDTDHSVRDPKLFEKEAIDADHYFDQFENVKDHLRRGNSYQVNLTSIFEYGFSPGESARDFTSALESLPSESLASYAHWTTVAGETLLLSNSPECLFRLGTTDDFDQVDLFTAPIKGTVKLLDNGLENLQRAKQYLMNSSKERAELLMIADLLRNDLNCLGKETVRKKTLDKSSRPNAEAVDRIRFMKVPGLLHQYMLLKCSISKKTSFAAVIRSLFPGGSIVGAPKKSTLQIIHDLEDFDRGFYCGSTILRIHDQTTASINIRSAELSFQEHTMSVGAGGGITVQSEFEDEFHEMNRKKESFTGLFL